MQKPGANQPTQECPWCGEGKVVRYLPKEIDRELSHEEITIPAGPKPETRTVTILRITYRREYVCSSCGHQWSQTYVTESQKHV